MAERRPGELSVLPFSEWTPDAASVSGGLMEAKNVISQGGRYAPLASPARYSNTARVTTGQVIGAFACWTSLGGGAQHHMFLAEPRKLYRLADGVPLDVSRPAGYATADPEHIWAFGQFGDTVLAGARGVPLQRFRYGTDRTFVDVPGTDAPKTVDALGRIGPHMVAADNLTLRWSAFNNVDSWTPDATTQAGATELPASGGRVMAIRSGESGALFQERAVHRLVYVGGSTVFQRDETETARGSMSPNGVVAFGRDTFYVSEEGFFVFDGLQSKPVGEGKVSRYFLNRLNYAYRTRISCALDVNRRCIMIAYPAGGSSTPTDVLIWSYADNRWTRGDIALSLLWEMAREGVSVDNVAAHIALMGSSVVDASTLSVDSPLFRESRRQWAGIDPNGYLVTMDGPSLQAAITTGRHEVMPGRNGFLSKIVPVIDAPLGIAIEARYSRNHLGHAAVSLPVTRRNLISYAADATNALVTKTRATATAGAIDPYGRAKATAIRDDSTLASTHFISETVDFVVGTYTLSALVKARGRNVRLVMPGAMFGAGAKAASFDLTARTVSNVSAGITTLIRPHLDGYLLIAITATATAAGNGTVQMFLLDGASAFTYDGNPTLGLDLAGWQMELGSNPTELIPTLVDPVTLLGAPLNQYGICPLILDARHIQLTMHVAPGVDWTEAVGLQHDARPSGGR